MPGRGTRGAEIHKVRSPPSENPQVRGENTERNGHAMLSSTGEVFAKCRGYN